MSSRLPKLDLSKSLYTIGLQCKKALWLKKYKPEVLAPTTAKLQAIYDVGNEVGALACELFPDGKKIIFKGSSFKDKAALTQKWINEGEKNIYEATFIFDDIVVMIDILHQKEDDSFEIYEVKSSTWHSNKSINDIYNYVHDVSVQYYVLKGLGFNVSNTYITLLNTDYVRGPDIDINQLFTSVNVTEEVLDLNTQILLNIKSLRETLQDIKNEPNIDIGWHCNNPYVCDAHEYCWKTQRGIPDYSIFNIFQFTKNSKSMQLYKDGITKIEDIPKDFKLTTIQELFIDTWKYKKSINNKESIKEFVDSLSYPIFHFDFETFNPAIPLFNGMSPYEKYPFQYSLHIEHEDGALEHKDYLAEPGQDPREEIVKRMIEDIPKGSFMMAYNISFEKGVIKKLADLFPIYEDHLMSLYHNFADLQTPFKSRDYLTPEMKGKSGLKTILPILVPEMQDSYNDLDMVHEGGDAMSIYQKLANAEDLETISRYKSSLIEYCKLDTYAMVKIVEKLRHIK